MQQKAEKIQKIEIKKYNIVKRRVKKQKIEF